MRRLTTEMLLTFHSSREKGVERWAALQLYPSDHYDPHKDLGRDDGLV